MNRNHFSRLVLAVSLSVVGVPATAGDDEEAANVPVQEINAWIYWYNLELDRLFEVKEVDGFVTGRIQKRHGRFPFRILKSAIDVPSEKQEATKEVVRELISWLVSGTDFEPFVVSKLQQLTGERFTKPVEWTAWYRANASRLKWSESLGHLITAN